MGGYRFRILKAQGANAPGGARSYVVDGKLTWGHALIAYPVLYGTTARVTYILSHDTALYRKDLGKDTAKFAAEMKAFNPDNTWEKTRIDIASSNPLVKEKVVPVPVDKTEGGKEDIF